MSKPTDNYPVARGFKPPPGYLPPHRRPAWRLFTLASIIVLIAGTAVGWFVFQSSTRHVDTPSDEIASAIAPVEIAPSPPPTPPEEKKPSAPLKPPLTVEEPPPIKAVPVETAKADANAVTFAQVSTLFQSKCLNCHGRQKQKGGLDLRTLDSILKGGDSGPAIVFGSLGESPLWQSVKSGQMPPDKKRKLTEKDLDLIKRWIETNAK